MQTPLIAVAALALAAPGCGSSKKTAAKRVASTTSAAAVPQDLAGAYKRFVSQADIQRTQKKRSELGPNQSKPKPEMTLLFIEPWHLTTRGTKQGDLRGAAGLLRQ